jgi:hypothetical protein
MRRCPGLPVPAGLDAATAAVAAGIGATTTTRTDDGQRRAGQIDHGQAAAAASAVAALAARALLRTPAITAATPNRQRQHRVNGSDHRQLGKGAIATAGRTAAGRTATGSTQADNHLATSQLSGNRQPIEAHFSPHQGARLITGPGGTDPGSKSKSSRQTSKRETGLFHFRSSHW